MALAHPEGTRRASFGWRVASAYANRREASIFLVVVCLAVYFSTQQSAFYSGDSIKNMAEYAAPRALIAAGEVMLLICGEIDLSTGRVFAFAPIVMYAVSSPDRLGLPIELGLVLALLASAGIGLLNGVVTVALGVPSFITTLGTLFFLNGIDLRMTGGSGVLTPGGSTFVSIFGGYGGYLNSEFWWALGLLVLMQLVLVKTRWGLHTVSVGGNATGAAESGVSIARIKIGNFVVAAVLAGCAGILDSVRLSSITPLQGGPDIMFAAVAAAVIGGTSLLGGSGTVVGAFLGVLALAILNLGFALQGVSAFNFDLIIGIAILVAMAINVQAQRLKNTGRLSRRG